MAQTVGRVKLIKRVRRIRVKKAEEESGRSAILLLCALVAVAWFSVAHGLQTLIFFEVRHWPSSNSFLNEAPSMLAPSEAPILKGQKIEHFNFQFFVPWKKVDNDVENPQYAVSRSDTGEVVVFFNPDAQVDVLQEMSKDANPLARNYNQVFGDQPFHTNYELYDAAYSATPAQAHLMMSREEALRLNSLLIWKLSFGLDAPRGIYRFNWAGLQGFQFGDPSNGDPVAIRGFDTHDRQFRFLFVVAANSGARFTQDDISQIVTTVRTVY
jgi:hypothetical protein